MLVDVALFLATATLMFGLSFSFTEYAVAGVHNAKAEECTTPRIGSRNIEIKIGGGGLPRSQK